MHRLRGSGVQAAGAVAVFLACICVAAAAVAATGPSVLRRSSASELKSLDPQIVVGNTAAAMMYDLFEGLLTYDSSGKLVPGLAESWAVSPDGLTYTFRLRTGLQWSDGTALTAQDFIYAWQRLVDPDKALRATGILFPIRNAVAITRRQKPVGQLGVRVPDPLTVEISLESPTPYILEILASPPAAPLPRHAIEKRGAQWTAPGAMVGNGAYVMQEWVANTYYRLVKNPRYRGSKEVSIDEVYYIPDFDANTSLKRFRAGELDVTLNVPPSKLQWLAENLGSSLRITSTPGIRYLILNNRTEPLDDARVRRALSLAVDRERIVTLIIRDGSKATDRIVPFSLYGHDSGDRFADARPQGQRMADAKRLLADAGYGPGKPLRFKLDYKPDEDSRRVAVALQSMWQAIGAQVELVNAGQQGMLNRLKTKNFDMAWYTYYAPFADPAAFLQLLRSDSFRNYSGYADPEFDKRLAQAERMPGSRKRLEVLEQTEQFAMAKDPVIPLFIPSRIYLVGQRVEGWENHAQPHLTRFLSLRN